MKKLVFIFFVTVLLIGCDAKKSNTDNLVGSWSVYKFTQNNADRTTAFADSFPNYTIVFDAGGNFVESYSKPTLDTLIPDSVFIKGKWAFENKYDYLTLTDTVFTSRKYAIYNLEAVHVELRKDSESRYLRKN